MDQGKKLRDLAAWYREFAERAGNPAIWDARCARLRSWRRKAGLLERRREPRDAWRGDMSSTETKGAALITGASSGIGAVYADRLANRGYDLILVPALPDRAEWDAFETAPRAMCARLSSAVPAARYSIRHPNQPEG